MVEGMGLGFVSMIYGPGFRVMGLGLGFRGQGLGVEGLRFRA